MSPLQRISHRLKALVTPCWAFSKKHSDNIKNDFDIQLVGNENKDKVGFFSNRTPIEYLGTFLLMLGSFFGIAGYRNDNSGSKVFAGIISALGVGSIFAGNYFNLQNAPLLKKDDFIGTLKDCTTFEKADVRLDNLMTVYSSKKEEVMQWLSEFLSDDKLKTGKSDPINLFYVTYGIKALGKIKDEKSSNILYRIIKDENIHPLVRNLAVEKYTDSHPNSEVAEDKLLEILLDKSFLGQEQKIWTEFLSNHPADSKSCFGRDYKEFQNSNEYVRNGIAEKLNCSSREKTIYGLLDALADELDRKIIRQTILNGLKGDVLANDKVIDGIIKIILSLNTDGAMLEQLSKNLIEYARPYPSEKRDFAKLLARLKSLSNLDLTKEEYVRVLVENIEKNLQ